MPYDLSGTHVTAISRGAYDNLRGYLGMGPDEPEWLDVIRQVVVPGEDLLERFQVDTRGLFPSPNSPKLVKLPIEIPRRGVI